nr:hypothetical protein [Myxococcota bacterium]
VDTGVGLAHWLTPELRLRHAVSAELTLPYRTADRRLVISGETMLERAFGRERAGLYPRRSIGLYLGGGWAAIEDGADRPVLRGGVMFGTRGLSYRLGTTYAPGDRIPAFELGLRSELRVD